MRNVHQTIIITMKMNIPRVYSYSNSQVIVNAINEKIGTPKNIINIIEDISH